MEPLEVAARERWNAQAEKVNQWSALSQDERDDLIAAEAARREGGRLHE
jgi:hypothetical protein